MATYSFHDARECVIGKVSAARGTPAEEEVALEAAVGRVLAEDARADRDYPATSRSIRDGYAVRADDLPGRLAMIGEVRAGEVFPRRLATGQAVEIMTGAPVPDGADAVVMVEQTRREGDSVWIDRRPAAGEFINPAGAEARAGDLLLGRGRRIGFAETALLAMIGKQRVRVYRQPAVAILSTGDEVVPLEQVPLPHQVRNSNAWSLAAQVRRAGGVATILPVAPDEFNATSRLVEQGLTHDLLLLSGGVSAGKYDIVEQVLAAFGAEFYFDRVLIQPGQPLVFGRARATFFFGLPGNPASTMVTFEIFARAALELLGGLAQPMLPFTLSRLTEDFRHKPGLTRFLPAKLSPNGSQFTPIRWQGSSDVPAMARADAFMVVDAGRESWSAGELMPVLLR